MAIELLYGKGRITVKAPPGCAEVVIRKEPRTPIADPARAIADGLARPIAAAPLIDFARGKKSACILICDVTRPVPNRLFLRPLIETLTAAGIPAGAITVLVATGLHRPNEGAELEALVGDPWVLATVRVEKLEGKAGSKVTFDEVIAVRTDEKKMLGGADAAKAKITGKIVKHVRGPKLKVLKYKTGGQYKIQTGHRQNYTSVEVGEIQLG